MSISALIRRMTDAGAPPEAIAIAVEAIEAEQSRDLSRRAKNAERKAASRARQSQDSHVTVAGRGCDQVSPKKETSPEPPKEKTTPSTPVSAAREFDQFWILFPNKVGKRDAEREFGLALKRSSFEAIMAGLRRYVAKTDDRPWCNPTTFLHQDRWNDQPAEPMQRAKAISTPTRQSPHNEILDAIIRGENVSPSRNTDIDASYERTDSGGSTGPVRLYALPSGRR